MPFFLSEDRICWICLQIHRRILRNRDFIIFLRMKRLILILSAILATQSYAQTPKINPALLKNHWKASWITTPEGSLKEYGVYLLRHAFTLESVPSEFVIHTSGDNRYRLYVNNEFVVEGPARDDLANYPFETVDIASRLRPGRNQIAVQLINFGEHMPWALHTLRTGFILQGNTEKEWTINTGANWKIIRDESVTPKPVDSRALNTFIVTGPGDVFDCSRYLWNWKDQSFDDSSWPSCRVLANGAPRGVGTDLYWMLVPRSIPFFEYLREDEFTIVRTTGINDNRPKDKGVLATVPPGSKVSILLDHGRLTIGYPEFGFSRGKGSKVTITYAEALFDKNNIKGNRNEIEGKSIRGIQDMVLPDGGANRKFTPLWNRTFRYVQLDIETSGEALTVHSTRHEFTAYPFKEEGFFRSSDPVLTKIWNTGWRTARLCAGDTYYDCPYYEQLQYVGDTRIQALISLYVSGDERLMRQAIRQFDASRLPEGLTQSRYPSNSPQVIPPYSLFWVAMVHDYWMHRPDEEFVRSLLPGISGVLRWYENHVDSTGLTGPMTWWNFVDWPKDWPWDNVKRVGGVPPGASDGHSGIITLQYLYALQYAAELFAHFKDDHHARIYREQAGKIKDAVRQHCWDATRGLFADHPEKTSFSQHMNIMAILTGVTNEEESRSLMPKILSDTGLVQCTFYYRFYLFRALEKTGMAHLYLQQLEPWREMLKMGLTTFAERPEPTRSDCHAWSAAPNYDLLQLVGGIKSAAPGFNEVTIQPEPGNLNQFEAGIPHPRGNLSYSFSRKGKKTEITVTMPPGLTGKLIYAGKSIALKTGTETFRF